MLQGSHDDVQEFAAAHALTVHTALNQQKPLPTPNSTLAEVVVTAASPLVGKTPKEKRINRNYGVSLLAVSRSGTRIRADSVSSKSGLETCCYCMVKGRRWTKRL